MIINIKLIIVKGDIALQSKYSNSISNNRFLGKEQAKDFMPWLRHFLSAQETIVLATSKDNIPYCNLMCFVLTQNNLSIIFITPKNTTKYKNICTNSTVSLLATSNSESESKLSEKTAVTINGQAKEVYANERKVLEGVFIKKYPFLEDFAVSSDSAVIKTIPQHIVIVSNFQQVVELKL